MTNSKIDAFKNQQYLNLQTYRKNGQSVSTPVWFVQEQETIYVRTGAESGKVKRIRNLGQVQIAPCDVRGGLLGEWVEADATLVEGEIAQQVNNLLKKKYGLTKAFFDTVSRLNKQEQQIIAIKIKKVGA